MKVQNQNTSNYKDKIQKENFTKREKRKWIILPR